MMPYILTNSTFSARYSGFVTKSFKRFYLNLFLRVIRDNKMF